MNEVMKEYDDAGLISKEFQEHDGAKDGDTLFVEYMYDESGSGGEFTNGLRPKSIRYPNGRLVHYTYGSTASDEDNINRLDAIKDDNAGSPGNTIASYTYVGHDMIVIEDYEEPDVRLDYYGGTTGTYTGLDRFDRVVDQRWYDYSSSTDVDRYKYGYDRASNRLWRENDVSKNLGTPVYLDEYYTYDGLNRLKNFDRGQLNGTNTGITGTPSAEEDWTLDPLGNWSGYLQKTSGTTDLDQSGSVNKVNEIANISETTGPSWVNPGYDPAGNMTSVPKPVDLTAPYDCTYDAWNRLVKVEDGAYTIGKYEYDALHRRAKKNYDSAAPDNPAGVDTYSHAFYNELWQIIETRVSDSESAVADSLQPQYQYVWSERYVDAPIIRDTNDDADGLCDDERIYCTTDEAHSVCAIFDDTGAVVERYRFDPYAKRTIFDAMYSSTSSVSSRAFAMAAYGYRADESTLFLIARHRVFVSNLGWTSRDPLFGVDSLNSYEYAASTPLSATDPEGTQIVRRRTVLESQKRRGVASNWRGYH